MKWKIFGLKPRKLSGYNTLRGDCNYSLWSSDSYRNVGSSQTFARFCTFNEGYPLGQGFFSRLTWQLPQTLVGDLFVSGANAFGQVNDVTRNYGMTAVDMGLNNSAITIGFYTAGPKGYKADWSDHLFVHEYGHYVQSQQHGPVYLLTVGIPSLQSAILQTSNPNSPRHDDRWFEADASYKGAAYFDKYYGSGKNGYVAGSANYFDRNSFINGARMPYVNHRTGSRYDYANPITGKFHWTDIPIYVPLIGLFPYLFY